MTMIYPCSSHRAEWNVMRQGFFCPKCDWWWSAHDIPRLFEQQKQMEERIAELNELYRKCVIRLDSAERRISGNVQTIHIRDEQLSSYQALMTQLYDVLGIERNEAGVLEGVRELKLELVNSARAMNEENGRYIKRILELEVELERVRELVGANRDAERLREALIAAHAIIHAWSLDGTAKCFDGCRFANALAGAPLTHECSFKSALQSIADTPMKDDGLQLIQFARRAVAKAALAPAEPALEQPPAQEDPPFCICDLANRTYRSDCEIHGAKPSTKDESK